MKILLASQSPYRRQLMDQLGVPYSHLSPKVDEEKLKKSFSSKTEDLPLFLARKKAESLLPENPAGITIGSDQMAVLDGERLDKPGSKEAAVAQLLKMQGKTHHLITALAVHYSGRWATENSITSLKMKTLTEKEIRQYVDLDNPIDCAGSYKIEKNGNVLFEDIQTPDPTSIVGLPLAALTRILEGFGVVLPK